MNSRKQHGKTLIFRLANEYWSMGVNDFKDIWMMAMQTLKHKEHCNDGQWCYIKAMKNKYDDEYNSRRLDDSNVLICDDEQRVMGWK